MQLELLEQLQRDRAEKRPVVLATNLKSGVSELLYPSESEENSFLMNSARDALVADRNEAIETDEGRLFLHVYNPPLRMLIVGAVHISQALVPMARLAAYDVTVIDPRRAFGSRFRFPGVTLLNDWPDDAVESLCPDRRTAVITLTHDPKLDDPALACALRSDAFYIGALGSRKTHAKRLQRLTGQGFGEDALARIHSPVGLDIGAKSPAEIAISIMGQVTEALRRETAPMNGSRPAMAAKEAANP